MVETQGFEHPHAHSDAHSVEVLLHMVNLAVCSRTRLRTQQGCSYHCHESHPSADAEPSRRICRLPSAELGLTDAHVESKLPHLTRGLPLEKVFGDTTLA